MDRKDIIFKKRLNEFIKCGIKDGLSLEYIHCVFSDIYFNIEKNNKTIIKKSKKSVCSPFLYLSDTEDE